MPLHPSLVITLPGTLKKAPTLHPSLNQDPKLSCSLLHCTLQHITSVFCNYLLLRTIPHSFLQTWLSLFRMLPCFYNDIFCTTSRILPNLPSFITFVLLWHHPSQLLSFISILHNVTPFTNVIFRITPRMISSHPSLLLSLTSSLQDVTPSDWCQSQYYSQENTPPFPSSFLHSCSSELLTNVILNTNPRRSPYPSLLVSCSSTLQDVTPFLRCHPVHHPILLSFISTLQNVTPFHQCHLPYYSQEITPSFTPSVLVLYSSECHPIHQCHFPYYTKEITPSFSPFFL